MGLSGVFRGIEVARMGIDQQMLSFQNNKHSWVAVARTDTSNITQTATPKLEEVSATVLTLCHLPIPYFLGVFNPGFFKIVIRDLQRCVNLDGAQIACPAVPSNP